MAATLQDLFDHYLISKPSRGKIRSASNTLIHICRSMNAESPEDIDVSRCWQIPEAIEKFNGREVNKATQEKSTLAEMIGAYGPRNGWEVLFEIFITDPDENFRQYALQTLDACLEHHSGLVQFYIKRFIFGQEELMQAVSIRLFINYFCRNMDPDFFAGLAEELMQTDPEIQAIFRETLLYHLKKVDGKCEENLGILRELFL